jgi:hypothetical protein
MFTSRMKRHSPQSATENMLINHLLLGCLFFSSRATSYQLSPSANLSTSHDFR